MRFITTSWLVILLVAVASSDSTPSKEKSVTKTEDLTDATSEKSITQYAEAKSMIEKDRNDVATVKDITMEEQFLIGRINDEKDKNTEENNQKNSDSSTVPRNENEDIIKSPDSPTESKINKDFIDIRRKETDSDDNQKNSSPNVQFDDSKTGLTNNPRQIYGQRSRKLRQKFQESVPLLQLTQGGYERPYKRPRIRDRYLPRPDSSDQSETTQQSENAQQLEKASNNRNPNTPDFTSQVTYSPSPQPPYSFGQGALLNSPFDASLRNLIAFNQILPPSAQNGFLNSPPDFSGYSTTAFQPQFTPNSDVGSIPSFTRDPNNAGAYQTMPSNPFQTPELLFQNSPQIQPQPVLIDSNRNVQTQFQQNPLPTYSGFESIGDSSTPSYTSFFRSPAMNTPLQVPPNFYGNTPNSLNPFNGQPISFLSQYPNFVEGTPNQIFQYPNIIRTQNNQQSSNSQQFDPDASQNENKAKVIQQNSDKQVNRDDTLPSAFGTNTQGENIANVYMRYPTVAGYAIEENLPLQNNSAQLKDDSTQSKEEQTNNPNSDPYRNILNSVRNYQRRNNSFDFPSEIFRSAPIDFGYQAPQGGIFAQYPDRHRAIPNYPTGNFEPRVPFNSVASLPETFLGINNQQPAHLESNETPSCAKENNVSVCFEDIDYPKNDILYTINSNPFLADRLLSPEPSSNSFSFVERSGNETGQNEENYACDVATKYGMPLRARNLAGMWRIIVNLEGRFTQPVRMEVCKTLGSSCNYAGSRMKTTCVQKFSLQRLLTWIPGRGIYSDVYKVPVACSCQIMETVES